MSCLRVLACALLLLVSPFARATDAPRDVRRCPKCGWYNLYEPPER